MADNGRGGGGREGGDEQRQRDCSGSFTQCKIGWEAKQEKGEEKGENEGESS